MTSLDDWADWLELRLRGAQPVAHPSRAGAGGQETTTASEGWPLGSSSSVEDDGAGYSTVAVKGMLVMHQVSPPGTGVEV
jgi:hypothetical protein